MAAATRTGPRRDIRRSLGDLDAYSQLTGPIRTPPAYKTYRVQFRNVARVDGFGGLAKRLVIALLNVAVEVLFFWWLLKPEHYPDFDGTGWLVWTNIFVVAAIGVMELFRLVDVISLSLASVVARDPIPVTPDPSLRLAFLTTIVPSSEPLSVVTETLRAARDIRYDGQLDVWLLDEGNDPDVIAACEELGVRHFTRRDIPRYNTRRGPFRARTKHGNYNSWLDAHGDGYDVLLSVDPDHVPLPNFVERILGYFRDPDVAYVVGPQCYKNSDTYVTRGAESQQFPFHGIIQRAANRYHAAMLVGTNNAIRVAALRSVNGLSDSITEDMATGIRIHTTRNPRTRRRWKSVYTPDVLAAGEGPASWRDYISQQMRWSRGTFEILKRQFWRRAWRLTPGQILHYCLITTFYPSMALGWLLGGINAVLYLAVGADGLTVSPSIWLALYVDATVFQLWLYVSTRRYNVSPYEVEGSTGLKGMLMSVISAPIYSSQLVASVLFRPARFVVTPKGTSRSRDSVWVFHRHLQWAALLTAALTVAFVSGHANPAVAVWPILNLLVCLAPLLLWRMELRRKKRQERQARAAGAQFVAPPAETPPPASDEPVMHMAYSPTLAGIPRQREPEQGAAVPSVPDLVPLPPKKRRSARGAAPVPAPALPGGSPLALTGGTPAALTGGPAAAPGSTPPLRALNRAYEGRSKTPLFEVDLTAVPEVPLDSVPALTAAPQTVPPLPLPPLPAAAGAPGWAPSAGDDPDDPLSEEPTNPLMLGVTSDG